MCSEQCEGLLKDCYGLPESRHRSQRKTSKRNGAKYVDAYDDILKPKTDWIIVVFDV